MNPLLIAPFVAVLAFAIGASAGIQKWIGPERLRRARPVIVSLAFLPLVVLGILRW
jgi:hypothetical protein